MLWLAAGIIVVVCWLLSFSKTYTELKEYRRMSRLQQQTSGTFANSSQLDLKEAKMDSLIRHFTVDSMAFEDNFLPNISLALHGIPVKVSYDGSKSTQETNGDMIRKQLILEGKYRDIVSALQKLEQVHYLNRCRMLEGGKCMLEVAVVKG